MPKSLKIALGVAAAGFTSLIIGVILLISVFGGGIKGFINDTKEANVVAKEFTTELSNTDYEAAFALSALELREEEGFTVESLQDFAETYSIIGEMTSVSFNSVNIQSDSNGKLIMVSGTISSLNESSPITVHLVEDVIDGEVELRVVFFSLNEDDIPEVDSDEDFDDFDDDYEF